MYVPQHLLVQQVVHGSVPMESFYNSKVKEYIMHEQIQVWALHVLSQYYEMLHIYTVPINVSVSVSTILIPCGGVHYTSLSSVL